ncbi:MAG: Hsp20/alpha crystallin family protein [bacterium]|nr:Hsp20/alpha crystallin family protein [bacterium]
MFPRTITPGLFERLAPLAFPTTETFAAPYDVYRFDDRVEVWMDLPGTDPDDIEITVEGREISITGRREAPAAEGATVVSAGRRHGTFGRRLHLGPELGHDAVQADYVNGVLKLIVPLAEQAKPRKVPVGTGSTGTLEATAA